MSDRYVLLSLAGARSDWSARLSSWATTGALPVELVRCISLNEVRSRLDAGRAYSALLLDAGMSGLDRDVLAAAQTAEVATIVVDGPQGRDWRAIGASHVLTPDFTRSDLLDVLAQYAQAVSDARLETEVVTGSPTRVGTDGLVVAVVGAGGVGTSTAAIALAEGLAQSAHSPSVLLADLCRVADQAMLHDSRVVVPSIQELVEAHRSATPRIDDVRAQTFDIEERGYHLLLGLRRPRQWVTLRPRAFQATLRSLRRAFQIIVADIEPDLEGEVETGSLDIEERHMMARLAALEAAAVVVVGRGDMKGLYGLIRVVLDLEALGVPLERMLPALSFAPRSPRVRADLSGSLATLVASSLGERAERLASPVFLPQRRVDDAMRDGVPMPKPLPTVLAGGVAGILNRELSADAAAASAADAASGQIAPGSLHALHEREAL